MLIIKTTIVKTFFFATLLSLLAACGVSNPVISTEEGFRLLSAQSTSSTQITLNFSEEVSSNGSDISNYSIDNLRVDQASVQGSIVQLTTSEQNSTNYTLRINNVKAASGQMIEKQSASNSFIGTESQEEITPNPEQEPTPGPTPKPTPSDTTPPNLNWLGPTTGKNIELGESIKLKIQATDNERVAHVDVSINSEHLDRLYNAPYELTIDNKSLKEGSYTFTATATDAAGNTISASITITIFKPIPEPILQERYSDSSVNINFNTSEHNTFFHQQVSQNRMPTSISSYSSSESLFAAAWQASKGNWVALRQMTSAQYQANFDKYVKQGYRLSYVDGYSVNGQTRYAAIWQKASGPAWVARHGMTSSQYQSYFNTYVAQGYNLKHVSGYEVNGSARYAAIWEKGASSAWAARHGMTSSQYQNFATEYVAKGYRITHVSGYNINGQTRFAAIMKKTSGPAWVARHDVTSSRFQTLHKNYTNQGYKLIMVDGYKQNDSVNFAAIWQKP